MKYEGYEEPFTIPKASRDVVNEAVQAAVKEKRLWLISGQASLLAAQFAQMWERLGKMNNFVIVEQGAHHGQFARDVLDFIQKRVPEFFDALCYLIVEPFPILQELQDHTLKAFQRKLGWCSSMQPFKGVHFSNELLDAMPVRLVSDGVEKFVALDGDRFVFV